MIVAVDTNCIIPGKVGGIESYTLGLIEALKLPESPASKLLLVTRPENEAQMQAFCDERASLIRLDRPEYQGRAVASWSDLLASDPVAGEKLLAEFQKRKIELLHRHGAQLVHFPGNTINPLDIDLPTVLNLHDIQFRHFPEYFMREELAEREQFWIPSARRADALVVASGWIADDFRTQMGIGPQKMFVAPEPFQAIYHDRPSPEALNALRRRMELPKCFFLYPAAAWEHKNHRRLIGAFIEANIPGAQLVLTGGGQEKSHLPAVVADLEAAGQVQLAGRVSTEDLIGLYHLATAMIFPSEFEAWSIPIMEAMACGCPVASSTATSLPEEVGDAGLLFEPRDVDAMAIVMRRLARDDRLCAELSQRGKRRVKEFTPERFAASLGKAYVHARGAHTIRRAA